MKIMLNYLAWPPSAAHEAIHYAAAHLLGLNAKIHSSIAQGEAQTEVMVQHEWQALIIALAPALVGPAVFYWIMGPGAWLITIAWLLGCWYDFVQVWQMAKDALSA